MFTSYVCISEAAISYSPLVPIHIWYPFWMMCNNVQFLVCTLRLLREIVFVCMCVYACVEMIVEMAINHSICDF